MHRTEMMDLLRSVASGDLSIEDAVERLDGARIQDLGFANLDLDRQRRRGFPEVVFCEGKAANEIHAILKAQVASRQSVLATRMGPDVFDEMSASFPDLQYDSRGRIAWIDRGTARPGVGRVMVVTAGTADLAVAMEAKVSLEVMGNDVELLADVGVAGLHRVVGALPKLQSARVILVVAGMEGALPSVVTGLVACPVIAVPTSIGYGVSQGGFAALLGMLSSCAAGLSVVNIDNGFGAAYAASLINHLPAEAEATGDE